MVLAGFDNWQQYKTIEDTKITVKGLEEGRQYMFRVKAKNDNGPGDPAVLPNAVVVKELVEEPTIYARDISVDGITRKAGTHLSFSLPISGKPIPEIEWKLNGEHMRQTSRVATTTNSLYTTITIKECNLTDAGVYSITASNIAGAASGKFIHCFIV